MGERREFRLPDADYQEILRLSRLARDTPVMALSTADALAGRDFASMARDRVMRKWEEIGKRLGFDWQSVRPTGDPRIVSAVSTETPAARFARRYLARIPMRADLDEAKAMLAGVREDGR